MSATIHKSLTREKALRVLPRGYRDQWPHHLEEPITLVLFAERVIKSRIVRGALERFSAVSSGSLVFAAQTFTHESRQLLAAVGARILTTATDFVL